MNRWNFRRLAPVLARTNLTRAALTCAALAATTLLPHQSVQAAEGDQFRVSVGTRAWLARWTSWFPVDTGVDDTPDVIQTETADEQLSVIPNVSVSYGKWLASLSALPETSFDFRLAGTGVEVTAKRRELDVNVGYFVIPGLAISLGYKDIQQDFPRSEFSWRGPIVGLSGSVPLPSDGWAFYGNFAVGFLKADGIQADSLDATYFIAEPGLAYVFQFEGPVQSLALNLGYRFQSVETDDLQLQFTRTKVYDITQGVNFGISASF